MWMQLLEFVIENRVLFMCMSVMMILAVIGYYADKTNFGLGKPANSDDNDDTKKTNDSLEKNDKTLKELLENQAETSDNVIDGNPISSDIIDKKTQDEKIELSQTKPNKENNDFDLFSMTPDSLLSDDNFNKFNEEFDSILPKKNLINSDLLDDIDDLELGKTQKFDLSDIADFGEIHLPKIKELNQDEQDIWKF